MGLCVRVREIDNMETTNKLETDFENYTMGIKQELFKENIYPYSACCHSNHVHNITYAARISNLYTVLVTDIHHHIKNFYEYINDVFLIPQ